MSSTQWAVIDTGLFWLGSTCLLNAERYRFLDNSLSCVTAIREMQPCDTYYRRGGSTRQLLKRSVHRYRQVQLHIAATWLLGYTNIQQKCWQIYFNKELYSCARIIVMVMVVTVNGGLKRGRMEDTRRTKYQEFSVTWNINNQSGFHAADTKTLI